MNIWNKIEREPKGKQNDFDWFCLKFEFKFKLKRFV